MKRVAGKAMGFDLHTVGSRMWAFHWKADLDKRSDVENSEELSSPACLGLAFWSLGVWYIDGFPFTVCNFLKEDHNRP